MRVDHVGSLLRPQALKDALRRFAANRISTADLRAAGIQRRMVEELVAAGCRYVQLDEPSYTGYVHRATEDERWRKLEVMLKTAEQVGR